MAIGKIEFSKLKNNRGISGSPSFSSLTKNNISPTSNYGAYNLYRNDTQTRDEFGYETRNGTDNPTKATNGHLNPVWEMLQHWGKAGSPEEHVYKYINKFRTLDFSFWGLGGSTTGVFVPVKNLPIGGDTSWGSWREKNPAGITVSQNVLLYPKDLNFKFGYSHDLSSAYKKLSESGLLSKVSGALETARVMAGMMGVKGSEKLPANGKMIGRMEQVPQWNGTSPIKFDGNLSFEFNFGSAGLFSGEHEVVRPILALASMWAPSRNGMYAKGIAPTGPTYLASFISAAVGEGKEVVKGGISGIISSLTNFVKGAAGDPLGTATGLEEKLHGFIDNALASGAKSIKTVYFRMGRMIFGPLIIKNINFGFDFTNIDEYGFPTKGTLDLSGCEQIFMATPDMFVGMFNGTPAVQNKTKEDDDSTADEWATYNVIPDGRKDD